MSDVPSVGCLLDAGTCPRLSTSTEKRFSFEPQTSPPPEQVLQWGCHLDALPFYFNCWKGDGEPGTLSHHQPLRSSWPISPWGWWLLNSSVKVKPNVPAQLPPGDVRLKWSPWAWICTSLETASSTALACSPQGSNSLDHQRFYNNYICSSLEIAQKKFVGIKKKRQR